MNVTTALKTKQAVRLFRDQSVPTETITAILDAGRRSQSSKNQQPWRFVVIREKATLQALSQLGTYAGHLAGADFAIALVSNSGGNWPHFDLGQAAAYLQLAAWEHGIGSCIASIYEPDKAKALLGIPSELEFWCAISFGYPSPDHKAAKLGGRKGLEDLVHWEKW